MADNYENMSDEDFSNIMVPEEVAEPISEEPVAEAETPVAVEEEPTVSAEPEITEEKEEPLLSDEEFDKPAEEALAEDTIGSENKADQITPNQSDEVVEKDPAVEDLAVAEEAVDYEAQFKRVMAPFKANGKDFEPKSPEEVIQLMQLGANYTKKMQAIQPSMKLVKMLDNHGLLDEEKLGFLIDLSKNDPTAIQKLLKDGQIDPLDLDVTSEPAYKSGNHKISDQEMAFHTALEDVTSTSEGKETVNLINSDWDHSSKQQIFQQPEILQIIASHRESGIYDQISAEINRRRTLGTLGTNTPFLTAYKEVGDSLNTEGKFSSPEPENTPATQVTKSTPTRLVGTRPATPKPATKNEERAKAASPARSAPAPATKAFDPFTMSDEEMNQITSTRI